MPRRGLAAGHTGVLRSGSASHERWRPARVRGAVSRSPDRLARPSGKVITQSRAMEARAREAAAGMTTVEECQCHVVNVGANVPNAVWVAELSNDEQAHQPSRSTAATKALIQRARLIAAAGHRGSAHLLADMGKSVMIRVPLNPDAISAIPSMVSASYLSAPQTCTAASSAAVRSFWSHLACPTIPGDLPETL